jgi:hypothetical protein
VARSASDGQRGQTAVGSGSWNWSSRVAPCVSIEIGGDKREVVAVEITGEERNQLYSLQEEREPQFAEYAQKTDRTIPVIELAPRSA